jgi:hypothetical protein
MPGIVIPLLFFATTLLAQSNHILIMGAGGEPPGSARTIFDQDVELLGRYLEKNTQWKPRVTFNGGHIVTELILETGVGKLAGGNLPFTPTSYESMISDYEMKIASGTIRPGEQLMIYVSTHGAQSEGQDKTHKIATTGGIASNLTSLAGAQLVSMDRLENLAKLASSRGVKLAIVDFSCHSGHTLKISDPNTCVISSTGTEHFGYSGFGGSFISNMRRGRNLEEVYLETFRAKRDRSFPMISTSVGRELHQEIYRLMTPYLYTYNQIPGEDKLQRFLDEEVKNNKCEEANLKFEQLQNLLTTIGQLNRIPDAQMKPLKESLIAYHQFQTDLRTRLRRMGMPDFHNKREKFCSDRPIFGNKGITGTTLKCDEWTQKEIMSMDYKKLIQGYESQRIGIKEIDMQFDASIANLKKAQLRRDILASERPDYKNFETFYKSIPQLEEKTQSLADSVSRNLERIYPELYRSRSRADFRPNPCKNFVL